MLKEPPSPQIARMLWSLLPYLPLGLLAGLLSGLLGIGGGLVFAPMLLLAGLEPHQALATSTLAIVPTTLGSTWTHLANRSLPWRSGLAIAIGAGLGAGLFSRVSLGVQGWQLLALQALMLSLAGVLMSLYPAATVVLAIVVLRERVTRWQVLGMVMALVAVSMISLHERI